MAAAAKQGKGKRKRDDADELGMKEPSTTSDIAEDTSKRVKIDEDAMEGDLDGNALSGSTLKDSNTPAAESSTILSEHALESTNDHDEDSIPSEQNVSKLRQEVRGHTSYLTFAILLPPIPSSLEQKHNSNPSDVVNTDTKS